LIFAVGFTVTITLKAALPHCPVGGVGITLKLADKGTALELLMVPVMALPAPEVLIVKLAFEVAVVQVYVVLAGTMLPPPLVGLTVKVAPAHIVVLRADGMVTFGFTVTTIVKLALLVQPLVNTGVTV
jgi:hypothetical protein